MNRRIEWAGMLLLIVLLFAIRNLPWHLDNFDQAKQAYTSFEMVELNHWLYQHTPDGDVATKPPLAGWISAALYTILRSWDAAWRLPPFAAALAIVWTLKRSGDDLCPGYGGIIAAAAFGLNSLAPRLATLVRTDMLLTFFIFGIGWMVFEKLRTGTPWTSRDRWLVFALMLGSMMTKGPIAYAFLLPGLALFLWRVRPRMALPGGWWPWFTPLLVFLLWAGFGALQSHEFYEQVVLKEFLGRFTVGEHAVHHNQPFWYYAGRLLGNFAPWSLLLIGLATLREVRAVFRHRPELLWLLCWAVGGMILMSLVPSKRADRIFPVIPPFCLLLAGMLREYAHSRPAEKLARWGIALGVLFGAGYALFSMVVAVRQDQGTLVEFGQRTRARAQAGNWRLAIVGGKDEGLLLYLRQTSFWKKNDAIAAWRAGSLDALVLEEKRFKQDGADFEPFALVDFTPEVSDKNSRYFLITRP